MTGEVNSSFLSTGCFKIASSLARRDFTVGLGAAWPGIVAAIAPPAHIAARKKSRRASLLDG